MLHFGQMEENKAGLWAINTNNKIISAGDQPLIDYKIQDQRSQSFNFSQLLPCSQLKSISISNCPEAGYCAKALSLGVKISQYLLTLNRIEEGYCLLGL